MGEVGVGGELDAFEETSLRFCLTNLPRSSRQRFIHLSHLKSFSFSFMSYSYERRRSDGVVHVEHARLRKQSRKENNRFADYMLNFVDLDTMEYGTCWQPLLLEFDGIELELS